MFDYQGRRQYSKNTGLFTVMTAPMRRGDFSELLTASKPVRLSDPVDPGCIVNNVIQPQCVDPHALEVLNFMAPVPNLPGPTQNLSQAVSSGNNWDQYVSRIDETINDRTRLYSRFAY